MSELTNPLLTLLSTKRAVFTISIVGAILLYDLFFWPTPLNLGLLMFWKVWVEE